MDTPPPAGYERVEIHNHDQTHRIPSGRRRYWAKIGWKWVYLQNSLGRRVRIPRKVFDIIQVTS